MQYTSIWTFTYAICNADVAVANTCFVPLCLLKNVGFAALASLFLLHIFLSLFGKKGGDTSMCTFSYVKFYVDVDIANICSVLLKNRRLSSCRLFVSASFLFFSLSRKNGGYSHAKGFMYHA